MKELLDQKVKDTITGLVGIAVTKCIFRNGCIQYAVQAKIDKDGKIPDEKWIDEQQLEVVKSKRIKARDPLIPKGKASGGGFRSYPGG